MLRSWKIGRAFGIPLYVHPSFLLLPALILWLHWKNGWAEVLFMTISALTVFFCVLLHELGHALMARRFAIPTRDITLYPIGGVARLERMTDKPAEELLIAVAGPAVNVVIAVVLLPVLAVLFAACLPASFQNSHQAAHLLLTPASALAGAPGALAYRFVGLLILSNIVLVVFNMIPAFPMDGGRVFRAFLAMFFGQMRATEVAAMVGLVMAGMLGLMGIWFLMNGNPLLLPLALFVALAGQAELRAMRYREAQLAQAQAQQYYPYQPYYPDPNGHNGRGYDPSAYKPARPTEYRPAAHADVETVVLRPSLSGEPARPDAASRPAPIDPTPAVPVLEPVPEPIPVPPYRPGFTGVVWDPYYRIWVRWENGRPVASYY
jgi:Zn-dependent protease